MTDVNDKASPNTDPVSAEAETNTIKVWDLPIRFFHWSLVILFIAAYITNFLGTNYFKYHVWCGYAIIVLVCFRIVWGFVGTYHARFVNFIRSPITTIKYALSSFKGTEKHYTGHNPLGAIMVIVLLVGSLIQSVTGLFTNDEILNVGPLYAYISDELSLKITSIHRQLFYWILGAVVLHVIAVIVHQFIKHDNIIAAMFKGTKAKRDNSENQVSFSSSKTTLALIILVILSLALAWIIYHAPEAVSYTEEY